MNTENLKKALSSTQDGLADLEKKARELKNQNLADVAASALGRIKQLIEHPDLVLVSDDDNDKAQHASNFDPAATFVDQSAQPRVAPFVSGDKDPPKAEPLPQNIEYV